MFSLHLYLKRSFFFSFFFLPLVDAQLSSSVVRRASGDEIFEETFPSVLERTRRVWPGGVSCPRRTFLASVSRSLRDGSRS